MGLTEVQISLVRVSWSAVAGNPDMAARLFYGRLFRIAPETRSLFRDDMAAQGAKLTDTLGFVIDHLDAPEALGEAAHALARRHVGYGVLPGHYALVGEALVWTLAQMLGPRFDAETRAAWVAAYDALSRDMIAAAYPELA
ncbi:MAG: globin family protein [Pikeienuella sp.]